MNLNQREQEVYKKLDPGQRHEFDALSKDTEFWVKVKRGGLGFIGLMILLAFIF